MSGPKKGEQCAAFFGKAGREASLANEGAVEEAAREGGARNGESYPPQVPLFPQKPKTQLTHNIGISLIFLLKYTYYEASNISC